MLPQVAINAARIGEGPVARISLGQHIPYGTGCAWTREYCGPGSALLGADWRPA